MSNSIRLLKSLQTRPFTPSRVFIRNAGGHAEKENIGGSIFQCPPGPRQMEQLKNWIPNLVAFGAVGFSVMLYFTDWKVVNTYIPFYGGKFKEGDDEK